MWGHDLSELISAHICALDMVIIIILSPTAEYSIRQSGLRGRSLRSNTSPRFSYLTSLKYQWCSAFWLNIDNNKQKVKDNFCSKAEKCENTEKMRRIWAESLSACIAPAHIFNCRISAKSLDNDLIRFNQLITVRQAHCESSQSQQALLQTTNIGSTRKVVPLVLLPALGQTDPRSGEKINQLICWVRPAPSVAALDTSLAQSVPGARYSSSARPPLPKVRRWCHLWISWIRWLGSFMAMSFFSFLPQIAFGDSCLFAVPQHLFFALVYEKHSECWRNISIFAMHSFNFFHT